MPEVPYWVIRIVEGERFLELATVLCIACFFGIALPGLWSRLFAFSFCVAAIGTFLAMCHLFYGFAIVGPLIVLALAVMIFGFFFSRLWGFAGAVGIIACFAVAFYWQDPPLWTLLYADGLAGTTIIAIYFMFRPRYRTAHERNDRVVDFEEAARQARQRHPGSPEKRRRRT